MGGKIAPHYWARPPLEYNYLTERLGNNLPDQRYQSGHKTRKKI